MLPYIIAAYLIIISLVTFIIRKYKTKNSISVDALVIRSESAPDLSDEGSGSHSATFRYSIDGVEYETWCKTGIRYLTGSTIKILIYRKDHKDIILKEGYENSIFYSVFIAILGIIIIYLLHS